MTTLATISNIPTVASNSRIVPDIVSTVTDNIPSIHPAIPTFQQMRVYADRKHQVAWC